jgi:hypothetical protein
LDRENASRFDQENQSGSNCFLQSAIIKSTNEQITTIFFTGKLMLTSEYVAVDGALVLAIPTKLGQELFIQRMKTKSH